MIFHFGSNIDFSKLKNVGISLLLAVPVVEIKAYLHMTCI